VAREVTTQKVRLESLAPQVDEFLEHEVVTIDGVTEPIEFNGRVYRFSYTNADREGNTLSLVFREHLTHGTEKRPVILLYASGEKHLIDEFELREHAGGYWPIQVGGIRFEHVGPVKRAEGFQEIKAPELE
jgi:hypothetical protein